MVFVDGLVKKPGEIELPRDRELRLLDALALAGGRNVQMADKVWVVRQVPGRPEPVLIEVSVKQAKRDRRSNLRLAAGDVMSVEDTPATFVYDLLKNFFRVGSTVPLY